MTGSEKDQIRRQKETPSAPPSPEASEEERRAYLDAVKKELARRETFLAGVEREIERLKFRLAGCESRREYLEGNALKISAAEAFRSGLRLKLRRKEDERKKALKEVEAARVRRVQVENETDS